MCELAAAAEASSEHPLARAVLEFADARMSSPLPADKIITSWALDGTGNMHGPRTPPHPQQSHQAASFKAAFSLDGDYNNSSSSSTPMHAQQQQQRGARSRDGSPSHLRRGGSGGGIQMVEVPLSSHAHDGGDVGFSGRQVGSSSNDGKQTGGSPLAAYYGGSSNWAGQGTASGAGRRNSSSLPGSPPAFHSRHHHQQHQHPNLHHHHHEEQQQHHHQQHQRQLPQLGVRVGSEGGGMYQRKVSRASSAGGSMISPDGTPRQVKHLLASGLLRVSEVEVR